MAITSVHCCQNQLVIRMAVDLLEFTVCDLNGCRYTEYPDGSLKVTDVRVEDSGIYSCEISTKLDSVSATGSITVQGESPDTLVWHSLASEKHWRIARSSDKPSSPHSLELSEKKERAVTLSWTPGAENNSPVSGNGNQIFDCAHNSSPVSCLFNPETIIHH